MTKQWQPHSWRSHEARQLPTYSDPAALAAAEKELAGYPPLVFAGEARELTSHLGRVAEGAANAAEGFGVAVGTGAGVTLLVGALGLWWLFKSSK